MAEAKPDNVSAFLNLNPADIKLVADVLNSIKYKTKKAAKRTGGPNASCTSADYFYGLTRLGDTNRRFP